MYYLEEIERYEPLGAQEAKDKEVAFQYFRLFPDNILTRENEFAHLTASSMIMNPERDKVLMIYHNIYNSWSWTGGHADGENECLSIALREAQEETGVVNLRPITDQMIAFDILPVWGHVKRGAYVSSHQHINCSYLFEADEQEELKVKADENSDVAWIPIVRLREAVTEPDMIPVYEKIIGRSRQFK